MNAPLRTIVARDFRGRAAGVESLECGHLHLPTPHPYYPDRHLEAKRRRCLKCQSEQAERERVINR